MNDRVIKRNGNREAAKLRGARKHEARVVPQFKRKTVISPTTQIASSHAPLSLIRPTEQMESLSVVPPVEGQELLQGAVPVVQKSPRLLPSIGSPLPRPHLHSHSGSALCLEYVPPQNAESGEEIRVDKRRCRQREWRAAHLQRAVGLCAGSEAASGRGRRGCRAPTCPC